MIRKFILAILLVSALATAWLVFVPRSYGVRAFSSGTEPGYWQLSTGSRIAYTQVTSPDTARSTPVIYLHGGPGGFIRDAVVLALAHIARDGHDLYLYDQFGGGRSGRAADLSEYTLDRHVRDLREIIDSVGTGKVVLIGQSWGAILATIFASRYPEKVERIVFICPGPIFPVKQERASMPAPDSIHLTKPILNNAKGHNMTRNIRMGAVGFFASRFGWKIASDKEVDEYSAYSGYYIDRSTVCDTLRIPAMESGHGYYAGLKTFESLLLEDDHREVLRKLRLPVLVLKGECDNQPWGYTSEYLEIFPNSALKMIQGAGHFLWIERPDELRQLIQQFLTRPE